MCALDILPVPSHSQVGLVHVLVRQCKRHRPHSRDGCSYCEEHQSRYARPSSSGSTSPTTEAVCRLWFTAGPMDQREPSLRSETVLPPLLAFLVVRRRASSIKSLIRVFAQVLLPAFRILNARHTLFVQVWDGHSSPSGRCPSRVQDSTCVWIATAGS